jgi:hypothetical protein
MYISAGRNRAVDEPVSYTAGVKKIGADDTFLTPEDRGIMTLDMIELDHQLSEEQKMISSSHRRSPSLPWFDLGKSTKWSDPRFWMPFTPKLLTQVLNVDNEERLALFQHVIQKTNFPAPANQSMMHTMITDRYYKFLPHFQNTTVTQVWWTHSIDAT